MVHVHGSSRQIQDYFGGGGGGKVEDSIYLARSLSHHEILRTIIKCIELYTRASAFAGSVARLLDVASTCSLICREKKKGLSAGQMASGEDTVVCILILC